ncbi:hypothetical protein ABIE52_006819 [Rhodococcus sp. OAS809]|uniref:hypothetical protein n=1 Tax=Rhodococcus sp. OAS809 TaxID=2663874 RepID=UPI00178B09D3
MSDTPDTTMPKTRRDLLSILIWSTIAVGVFQLGHIPGVVNSATLIAAGSAGWAALKLVAVMRRAHRRVTTRVRNRLSNNNSRTLSSPSFPPRVLQPGALSSAGVNSVSYRMSESLVSHPRGKE